MRPTCFEAPPFLLVSFFFLLSFFPSFFFYIIGILLEFRLLQRWRRIRFVSSINLLKITIIQCFSYINERGEIKYPISLYLGKIKIFIRFFFFFFFFFFFLSFLQFLEFRTFFSRFADFHHVLTIFPASRSRLSLSFSPRATAFPQVPFFSFFLSFSLLLSPHTRFRRIFLGSPIFYHVSLVILGIRTWLFLRVPIIYFLAISYNFSTRFHDFFFFFF